nr:ribonuclease H-like domain-containing protein [Tanacetum cinerariifolium]
MGLWYPKDTGFELTAFSDSDHAGCLDSRKSTSGGIQFLGGDKLVSWSSKKQDCTSMSSTEAEYVSLSAKFQKIPKRFFSTCLLESITFTYLEMSINIDTVHNSVPNILGKCTFQCAHSTDIREVFYAKVAICSSLRLLKPNSEDGNPARANVKQSLGRPYALSWKPYQGDSLNLPDHRYIVDIAASFQRSRIHKPHAHTQAFKVNQRFIDWGDC